MQSLAELTKQFRDGAQSLSRMADQLDYPWTPALDNPRRLHNVYARSLITCYVSKVAQLSEVVVSSAETGHYLIYALAGRSLIECAATLRYYVLFKYKPLMDRTTLDAAQMKELIRIDDQHLRGGRFDWESFFSKQYSQLIDDAVKQLESKKSKQKHVAKGIIAEQVNVLTCIEKWAEENAKVLVAYNLFCELVHPNIGSAFLVASTNDKGLYFTQSKGNSVGADIFAQTLPILASVTLKPFGQYLTMLMGTVWQDDEL
jgi:hypothetical protein